MEKSIPELCFNSITDCFMHLNSLIVAQMKEKIESADDTYLHHKPDIIYFYAKHYFLFAQTYGFTRANFKENKRTFLFRTNFKDNEGNFTGICAMLLQKLI